MNRSIVRIVPLQTLQRKINEMQPGEELFFYSEPNFKTQLLRGHNHPAPTPPPFNCLRCTEAVQQTLSQNRRINTCNCLTAIFSAPYSDLSQQQWQQWGSQKMLFDRDIEILHVQKNDTHQNQALKQINYPTIDPQKTLSTPPINQNPNDTRKCWCAFCELPDQIADPTIHLWDSTPHSNTTTQIKTPSQNVVCTYNLCTFCAGASESTDELFLARFHNSVKQNLLRKYPSLYSKVHPAKLTTNLAKRSVNSAFDLSNISYFCPRPSARARTFSHKSRKIPTNYLSSRHDNNQFKFGRRNLRSNSNRRRPNGQ
jgi:hypothetical protein